MLWTTDAPLENARTNTIKSEWLSDFTSHSNYEWVILLLWYINWRENHRTTHACFLKNDNQAGGLILIGRPFIMDKKICLQSWESAIICEELEWGQLPHLCLSFSVSPSFVLRRKWFPLLPLYRPMLRLSAAQEIWEHEVMDQLGATNP